MKKILKNYVDAKEEMENLSKVLKIWRSFLKQDEHFIL